MPCQFSRSFFAHPSKPPTSLSSHHQRLDKSRKNQCSTKSNAIKLDPETESNKNDDEFPPSPPSGAHSYFCHTSIIEPTGQIYTDQTGKFVTPSSTGNNYLLVLCDCDSNAILAEPVKSRHATAILNACKIIHAKLCAAGLHPKLQRLDDECSAMLKALMHKEEVDFQLVPPGVHCRNAAERAICTFKNHFIAGLCSVDKDFPLHLWDCLLPQTILSINVVRGSLINPKLSAWAQLLAQFDFNKAPVAPSGIRVIAHEKPDKRSSWSPHGLDGWCVGPALKSHCCCTIWIAVTRGQFEFATLSLGFQPKHRCPLRHPMIQSSLASKTFSRP